MVTSCTRELLYRWVRENKLIVATAATSLWAILVTVVIAFVWITSALDQAIEARESEKTAKQDAIRQKQQAEQATDETKHVLAQADFLQAVDHFERGRTAFALARLARCLRTDPDHRAAASMTYILLVQGWFPQQLLAPIEHGQRVDVLRFSPDGTRLLAGTQRELHLWDPQTGNRLIEPIPLTGRLKVAEFSPDGSRIVAATHGKLLVHFGVWGEAFDTLTRALEEADDDPETWYLRHQAQLNLERPHRALRDLQRAIELQRGKQLPDDETLSRYLAEYQSLENQLDPSPPQD